MNIPLVSIVMSVRNGADTIKETIESLIAQTYKNWELTIRDNCSTDDTVSIINSFDDMRIHLVLNKNDKGSWYNNILLIDSVKGKYIKLIDDDSYLYPTCIEKQVQILEMHSNIISVTCDTEYRCPGGRVIDAKIPLKNDIVTRDEYIKYTLTTCRGSVQEGNQTLYRAESLKFAVDRTMAIGLSPGLVNAYSITFYLISAALTQGDLYIIRETLSAGRIEANSHSMKFNQAKLQPAWIKLLRLDGYAINPFLYIWAHIMILVRSTARRLAFKILGRT